MINRYHFFSAILFCSLLGWLPLAMKMTRSVPKGKTLARLNTVTPAECGGSRGIHIFPFSDFGSGSDTILPFDPGWLVPEYIYDTVGPPERGAYTITNNTSHWEGEALDWLDMANSDPNDPEGYVMVINGDPPAGPFLEFTIDVCESTNYNFGFNILNLYDTLGPPVRRPNIDVLIDGTLFYAAGNIPRNGQWTYHDFNFKTEPGVTQVTISMINQTFGGTGNVFALDDFFLGACGPDLRLEEIAPQPRCVGDTVEMKLSIFGTPFDTNYVQWQTSVNHGRRWTNYGEPSADSILIIEGLPDGIWVRALLANTRAGAMNSSCRVFVSDHIIQYNNLEDCANYPFTDVGALCSGNLGENVFPIGDFGSGAANVVPSDPGISPFYEYQPNPPPNDGFYTITNNTTNWPSFGEGWLDTRDNSPDPEGYFMVINADRNPGIFFIDTVEVCENTLYEFSTDVFNLHQDQPTFVNPNIEFQINDVNILRSGEVPQDSMWHNYGFTFMTKPGITELILSIRNFAPGGQDHVGNDFALDNIQLRPCGPTVHVVEVDPQSHCVGDPIEIRADISEGFSNPSILWQMSTDGETSWQDFQGPSADSILLVHILPDSAIFRALIAETADNILQPSCRIVSNSVPIAYFPFDDCWETPIDVFDDLCNGSLGANGVENGDFGRDTSLFASPLEEDITTYTFLLDSFNMDGGYTITNNLNYDPCFGVLQDTCWIPIESPVEDSLGYFMVVNSDFEPGIFFRGEVEGLCEDINYQFSADIINLNRTFFYPFDSLSTDTINPPNVDFIVGQTGVTQGLQTFAPAVYNTGDILNDSMWHTFGFTFSMKPGEGSLSFALRNNAPGGAGNDLALDNIIISVCGPEASIAPYQICTDEPLTLEAEIVGDQFPNQVLQWEQSTDGGMSWSSIAGATSEQLFIPSPVPGHQYRYLVANDVSQLSAPLCHISSEIDTISIQPAFITDLVETICEGERFMVGTSTYTTSGMYQDILEAENGCDSLVLLDLTVNDSILTVVDIGLCAGEDFQGIRPTRDTVITFFGMSSSGCDSTLQVNVYLSQLNPFEIIGDTVLCFGGNTTLSTPELGRYTWSTGDTTQSIMVNTGGTYRVTISDGLGCEEMSSMDVEASQLQSFTLTVNDTLCVGETTTLTAPSDGNYLWSTDETTRSITISSGGDYTLTITDDLGCEESATATVIGTSLSAPLEISGNPFLCQNESVILTAEANGNYLWSNGETTQSISINMAGSYGVTVTDALGCEVSSSIEVTQTEIQVSIDIEAPTCTGDSNGRLTIADVIGANGKVSYQLNSSAPQESPIFDNLPTGTYALGIQDEQGCSFTEEVIIPEGEQLSVSLLPLDKPLRLNDSIQLIPQVIGTPDQIRWSPVSGLSCSDCLEPIAKPSASRTYELAVTSPRGCSSSASIFLEVDNTRRIYIPNALAPDGNEPNNQFFTIYGGNEILQINQLVIFDRWGNQVFKVQDILPGDPISGWDGTFNGQPMQAGVYIYYAEVAFADGVEEVYSGDVTLVR